MVLGIPLGRGALMKVKAQKRAGELLCMEGCIFFGGIIDTWMYVL
jgi:hypothetical protein